VLGGTKQRGDSSLKPRKEDAKFITKGAAAMMPAALASAKHVADGVGLRPGRGADGVRLERETLRTTGGNEVEVGKRRRPLKREKRGGLTLFIAPSRETTPLDTQATAAAVVLPAKEAMVAVAAVAAAV
jgi:hypothetical protein